MTLRIIILFIFALAISACSHHGKTITTQSRTIDTKTKYELLNGTWELQSYDGYFSSDILGSDGPNYKAGEVLYQINLKDYKLIVSKNGQAKEHDYSMPAGEFQFWANDALVKFGNQYYMYSFEEADIEKGKKESLTLDSNYDPSLGPDGIVFYFERVH